MQFFKTNGINLISIHDVIVLFCHSLNDFVIEAMHIMLSAFQVCLLGLGLRDRRIVEKFLGLVCSLNRDLCRL